jgi:Skp family chaperone for outer membrane proteins
MIGMGMVMLSALPLYGESSPAATNTAKTTFLDKRWFAILDHDYIMQEALAARQARLEIDKQRTAFQEEIKQQEQKLREWEKNLIDSQQTLTEEEYARKRHAFEEGVSEAHKAVAERRTQLEESFNHARETIVDAILKIVADISREQGYDVVFPRSIVFYANEAYDITDEVLTRLNKTLPSVSIEIPAQIKQSKKSIHNQQSTHD